MVYLSDEDEQSTAPSTATTAGDVLAAINSVWPTGKKVSTYGIIIQPGDTDCLNAQRAQFGGNGYFGTRAQELADATRGMTVSICESDYSSTLQQIG